MTLPPSPYWSPNWTDVSFDHAAAQAYADALRRLAKRLDDVAERRLHHGQRALEHWTGLFAFRFDMDLAAMRRRELALRDGALRSAGLIEHAADEAREEQRRREQDRERWRDELEELQQHAARVAP